MIEPFPDGHPSDLHFCRSRCLSNRILTEYLYNIRHERDIVYFGHGRRRTRHVPPGHEASLRRPAGGEADTKLEDHIAHRENVLDNVQREITKFLGKITVKRVPSAVSERARRLLRISDELESVSDEASTVLKVSRRLRKDGQEFSDPGPRRTRHPQRLRTRPGLLPQHRRNPRRQQRQLTPRAFCPP